MLNPDQVFQLEKATQALQKLHQEVETKFKTEFNGEDPDLGIALINSSLGEAVKWLELTQNNQRHAEDDSR
jgi:hypothetical protein